MDQRNQQNVGFYEWLGLNKAPNWVKSRALGGFAGFLITLAILLLIVLFMLALAAAFVVVYQTISPSEDVETPNLGVRALLTALLSAPFIIWRTMVAQWTVDHQRESLFNDKLNAASKDLAAWREVTRVVGEDGDERVLTTREPDLVTRATAIDRLYGLIKERPSEASRIAAMLSLYVREHTVQVGDKIPDVPPVPVPENATPDELREWAFSLQVGRSDLQKAVQAIGRIRDIPGVELEDNAIDLRGANLQAMDLSGLNLGKGKWQSAQMQGASLMGTQMQGAKLLGAQMQGAYLISAQMQGADLSFARMQGAILWSAQMQGANFRDAQMQGADLRDALMQGAAFIDMLINERQIYHHTKDVFGDGSIRIDPALFPTDGDAWPDHWPTKQLEWEEFNRQWRDWVAQNHPDVLQYLPDGVRNA